MKAFALRVRVLAFRKISLFVRFLTVKAWSVYSRSIRQSLKALKWFAVVRFAARSFTICVASPVRQLVSLRGKTIAPRLNAKLISSLQPRQQKRSEEHTSELQSRENLVCRLLLEKKKNILR